MDESLTGTITLGQSVPRGNSNEGVLHIPQSSRAGTLPSDSSVSYLGHLLGGGILPTLRRCSWHILQLQPTGLKCLFK